jgi:hypothetical protein
LGEIWRGVTSSRLNGTDKISILTIVDEQEILRPQYLVRSKQEIKVLAPVFNGGI